MNILMTNDDGINCEGLKKLAALLRSRGEHRIFVLAPDSDRSGVSHGVSVIKAPLKLSALGADTWTLSGNPADCVIVAALGALPVKPDLVLSGINKGQNLGSDLIYSGTAAAARQASMMDIPAVALSLAGNGEFYWDMAAAWSADHLEELAAFWKAGTFVNVNIPNCSGAPGGLVLTWPAVKHYNDKLKTIETGDGNRWCLLDMGEEPGVFEKGSDCEAVSRNLVSVSPVSNHPVVRKDLCPGVPDYAAVAPGILKQEQ